MPDKNHTHATFQKRDIATIMRPGEFPGVMSPLFNQTLSATVTSVDRSRAQIYSEAQIAVEIRSSPDLALDIIRSLSERLHEVNQRLAGTMHTEAHSNNSDRSS